MRDVKWVRKRLVEIPYVGVAGRLGVASDECLTWFAHSFIMKVIKIQRAPLKISWSRTIRCKTSHVAERSVSAKNCLLWMLTFRLETFASCRFLYKICERVRKTKSIFASKSRSTCPENIFKTPISNQMFVVLSRWIYLGGMNLWRIGWIRNAPLQETIWCAPCLNKSIVFFFYLIGVVGICK